MTQSAGELAVSGSTAGVVERVRTVLERWPRRRPVDRPRVTLTYAQSVDGCLAAEVGASTRISGESARALEHQLRALHSGILVGVSTVLIDDPHLTVRHAPGIHPRPIILDSTLRTPLSARLMQRDDVRPIIATTRRASADKARMLTDAGASIVRLAEDKNGRVDLDALGRGLLDHGIESVMIEGGAGVITGVLRAQIADQLVLFIAPHFLGGMHAVSGAGDVDAGAWPKLENTYFGTVAEDLVLYGEFVREP